MRRRQVRVRVVPGGQAVGVGAEEFDVVEREPDRGAVEVDEPPPLEGVADDGQVLRPDAVDAPEEREGEEDVVVGIQGAVFDEDAGCFNL